MANENEVGKIIEKSYDRRDGRFTQRAVRHRDGFNTWYFKLMLVPMHWTEIHTVGVIIRFGIMH